MIKRSITEDKPITKLCKTLFKDLAYGLKIIVQHQGSDELFVLDKAFVQNPEAALSEWVKKSFEGK